MKRRSLREMTVRVPLLAVGCVIGVGTVVCACLVGPAAQLFFPVSEKIVKLRCSI